MFRNYRILPFAEPLNRPAAISKQFSDASIWLVRALQAWPSLAAAILLVFIRQSKFDFFRHCINKFLELGDCIIIILIVWILWFGCGAW